MPRSLRRKSKEVQEEMLKLENKLGRTPTNLELAEHLKMPLKELEEVLADTVNYNVTSLEDLLANKGGEHLVGDEKEISLPEKAFERKELKEILGDIIEQLPSNQKTVISLYYYEELTYKEIGKIMELSSQEFHKYIARPY